MRVTATWVCLGILAGLATTGFAQQMTITTDKGKSVQLGVTAMKVDVDILGPLAQTTITLTFANKTDRPMAGDFTLPLPTGATVSGYALDIQGKMVPGVPVEQKKARVVFEKEKRKGVDPGLAEWAKGNVFRTRVFPIPAKGVRTVSITYVHPLPAGQPIYTLPIHIRQAIPSFSLNVLVVGQSKPPAILGPLAKAVQFTPVKEGFLASYTAKDILATGTISVQLRQTSTRQPLVQTASDGNTYFLLPVRMPVWDPLKQATPKRITLLWDASASRTLASRKNTLAVVRAYVNSLSAPVQITIQPFRETLEPPMTITVKPGDSKLLVDILNAIPADGGTRMGCLNNLPADAKPDLILLCSDGLSTLDNVTPTFKAPVFALSSDVQCNQPLLGRIARASGGAALILSGKNPQADAADIGAGFYGYLCTKGSGFADLLPAGPQRWKLQQLLVGRLTSPTASLTVEFGRPSQPSALPAVTIHASSATRGELLRTYWAEQKLFELLENPTLNATAIGKLGKTHSLVTPGTSLMVLETLEQYVEHKIAPPRVLAKMRQEYMQKMDTVEKQRKTEQKNHLETVVASWQDRVKWWKNAPKPKAHAKTYPRVYDVRDLVVRVPDFVGTRVDLSSVGDATEGSASGGGGLFAEEDEDSCVLYREEFGDVGLTASTSVAKWTPKGPYIDALNKAQGIERYATYLVWRDKYANSPGFFFDVAEWFYQKEQPALAARILTNIAEMDLGRPDLLRVVGYRLAQAGQRSLARAVFEQVLLLRPEEPQSHRDLASVLQHSKNTDDQKRAIALLYHVATHNWTVDQEQRFAEIELIALMELNALLAKMESPAAVAKAMGIDKRLVQLLDLDVRIVLQWDADLTDMDLHVIEPSGEEAYYSHRHTASGGLVSRDFTQGYGPEEYLLRNAAAGKYAVRVKYYGSDSVALIGAVTIRVTLITNFGRPTETRKTLTRRMADVEKTIPIGELLFTPPKP